MDISKWGLTDTGFYRPTLYEIIAEKEKQAKLLFGEDFDTSEQTPQGKYIRINAKDEARLYEQAENLYYCINPSTARGVSLDRAVKFVAAIRNPGTCAKHLIRLYGVQNTNVPIGYLIKTDDEKAFFWVTENAVINQEEQGQEDSISYYADVVVQCTESGTVGNVRNINSKVYPDENITAITYLSTVAVAEAVESDTALRERFYQISKGLGANTAAAIKANVLRVENVTNVDIIDNNTTVDIPIGNNELIVSAKTYAVIVNCADKSQSKINEIAQAICEKQPLGIVQSGVEVVITIDASETQHVTAFTFVNDNFIDVDVTCAVTSAFPANGIEQIENNIAKYLNGLAIGERVVYSRIYDYIYNVAGVDDVLDLKVNGDTRNVEISKISIARAGNVNITRV